MITPFKEFDFKIPFRKIKESHCWQLSRDIPLAKEIISPLFDIGVDA